MLGRARLVTRQRTFTPLLLPRQRHASTAHSDHHNHHQTEEDSFATPAWRRFFVVSLIAGALYQLAPKPSEEAFITRWLAMYTTTSEKWLDMNVRHTVLSVDAAEGVNLFTTASRPAMYRMRFPQMLDNASPFNVQVGLNADTRDFVAKTEKE
ncbi:hypothetical protein F5880DRAFT_1615556 [Lentinula raphanica]|nr:hypothetical protein F5880DRAFT_1615556 [Lentinula raphanica]